MRPQSVAARANMPRQRCQDARLRMESKRRPRLFSAVLSHRAVMLSSLNPRFSGLLMPCSEASPAPGWTQEPFSDAHERSSNATDGDRIGPRDPSLLRAETFETRMLLDVQMIMGVNFRRTIHSRNSVTIHSMSSSLIAVTHRVRTVTSLEACQPRLINLVLVPVAELKELSPELVRAGADLRLAVGRIARRLRQAHEVGRPDPVRGVRAGPAGPGRPEHAGRARRAGAGPTAGHGHHAGRAGGARPGDAREPDAADGRRCWSSVTDGGPQDAARPAVRERAADHRTPSTRSSPPCERRELLGACCRCSTGWRSGCDGERARASPRSAAATSGSRCPTPRSAC